MIKIGINTVPRAANFASRLGIAPIVGLALIVSLLFSPLAMAGTEILEVQPWPNAAPTQLIVWGTEFGPINRGLVPADDTPMIRFGTQSAHLRIAASQLLCPAPLGGPSPPLEAGTECVVVDLPVVANGGAPSVPAGDYLLAIWVELENSECVAKPSSLTFLYQPTDCSGANAQNAACAGDLTGSVVFTAAGSKWPNELGLTIDPPDGVDDVQTLQIHTSCSQALVLGGKFGSLELTAMNAEALGSSTQHALYDLTLGAVGPDGPQGVQGKLGDTRAQGVQGKLGDTGAQGVQGKLGDTGDQGVQGKLGDTGDQGVQGKLGDTGAQGVQGKARRHRSTGSAG